MVTIKRRRRLTPEQDSKIDRLLRERARIVGPYDVKRETKPDKNTNAERQAPSAEAQE